MPWTQTKYPASMKNLPVAVRKKAIQIANAILKEDKKMKEGVVIATAIKNAESLNAKKSKIAKAAPKKKVAVKKAAVKKVAAKSPVKAKAKKKVASKKVAVSVKKKTKVTSVKKAKVIAKKGTKTPVKASVKTSVKVPVKTPVKASEKTPVKAVVKKKNGQKGKSSKPSETVVDAFIIEPLIPIEEALHEDLHFIPKEGDVKPIDPIQIHNFENVFHHREEVAMHQGNKKVNDAKASRKSYKRTYRMNGNR